MSAPLRRTGARDPRLWVWIAALTVLAGCRTDGEPGLSSAQRVELEDLRLSPEFRPALEGLSAAVEAHEDALARRILRQIRARGATGPDLEFALALERVLDGRVLVAQLELALEAVADEVQAGSYRLELVARHSDPRTLTLHLPPATLKRHQTSVAPKGSILGVIDGEPVLRSREFEGRTMDSDVVDGLENLALEPGVARRVVLCEYEVPVGTHLAVRNRWTLHLHAGEIEVEDQFLPAQNPPVAPAEQVVLASYLPTGPVEPDVFVSYACGDVISPPALMERAVRIPPSKWVEALALLAAHVDELSDDRLTELSPGLRWLARTSRPGTDGAAWRRRLVLGERTIAAERAAHVAGAQSGGLDFPSPPVAGP